MFSIDESFVDSAAPNADAAKNGRSLVLKKKFLTMNISDDKTILFGECQGSGKTPYQCSCDFIRPGAPTYRCNCPSRQFPCKHSLGLMYAYVQKSDTFQVADVPDDLQAKRDKVVARVEKKKEEQATPKQVNKTALAKKIKAQLDGINLLEQLTIELASIGIGNMNAKLADTIEQRAKQLGDAYLPGAQSALLAYTTNFSDSTGKFDDKIPTAVREAMYSDALDQLARLHALVKQGRAYLEKRLNDPDLKPETESPIAAWLGHAWHLSELREAGLTLENAELLQLAFNSNDDVARREFVDTGIWVELSSGKVLTTKTYRPYKAVKFIKSEDSFFQVAQVPLLCIYPGDMNPRCRWDEMLPRPTTPEDYQKVQSLAAVDFSALTKTVKNNLKGPLSEKQPVCLLRFKQIGLINDVFVIEDQAGNRLTLTDRGMSEEPSSVELLRLVPPDALMNQVLVGRFRHDLDSCKLEVKPLSIVTNTEVIRLTL
ncbi:MAG: hypothetical protein R3B84_13195 [Zavarzinella sp.]